MHEKEIQFAIELMKAIRRERTEAFSGLGVVFYVSPANLPIAALGRDFSTRPKLPVSDMQEIVHVLSTVADRNSPWHDGFHLVDMTRSALTHLSQFVSPPLDGVNHIPADARPTGARQMTAQLTSQLPGVGCVALLSVCGDISIYQQGKGMAKVAVDDE